MATPEQHFRRFRERGEPDALAAVFDELASELLLVAAHVAPAGVEAEDLVQATFLTVLDEFGAYPAVIQRELDRYLPFLATTRILIAAVRAGVGRETAHEVIKEHAVAVALAMREHGAEPDLLDRLAADPRLPLDRVALDAALADKQAFTGAAGDQVDRVVAAVDDLVGRFPEAARYTSDAIL